MRAIAALMVIIFHFFDHHREIHWIWKSSIIGQSGVDLFFVLSGFLITRILLASKNSTHFFESFYARRTLRIFPLYFGFLAIYFFLLPAALGDPIPSFGNQAWSWFYLENVPQTFRDLHSSGPGHFWSLAVEEHFYLIWPLLVFWLSRRSFAVAVVATLILPLIMRGILVLHGIPVFYFTLTRMDALGYGAALALVLTNESFSAVSAIRLFRMSLGALAAVLIPLFLLFSGSRFDWLQVVKLSLIPAFYSALIGLCIVDPVAKPLTNLLSIGWLRWLGGISYGLYVFNPTCLLLVQRLMAPNRVLSEFVLSTGLTVLTAFLSFRFFESPILKLKKRFAYDSRARTA